MEKDKIRTIKRLMYLRSQLDVCIDEVVSEKVLRDKDVDAEELRESLLYRIDENLDYLRQNR